MGINVDEVYAGANMNAAYVKAMPGSQAVLKIIACSVAEFGEEGEERKKKVVLHFENEEKHLPLNATNKGILRDAFGPDTDEWINKTIKVYVIRTSYMGKAVDGIMVEATKPQTAPAPQEPPPKICLGEVGAKRLTAALSGKSLDIAALRAYLHTKAIPHRSRIDQPPEQWPSDWGQEIRAWLENPTTVEQPYVPIDESDLPF